MREPISLQAQLWLNQYWQHFGRWAESGMRDTEALQEAAAALRALLLRCPGKAADVERIAAIACFASRRSPALRAVADLARCGLQAANMATETEAPRHAPAILLLALAEAELHARRRAAGLEALRRLERRLATAGDGDAFSGWIRGRTQALLGDLHELGREEARSRDSYAAALKEIMPLLDPGPRQDAFLRAWAEAMEGRPADAAERPAVVDGIALSELGNLATLAAIGLARSLVAGGSRLERAAAARRASQAVASFGTPPDLSPFEVIPVIGALPPDEASAFADLLVATIDRQRRRLEEEEVPAGISDEAAVAIVRGAQRQQAELLARQVPVFAIAGALGVALAQQADGDAEAAERTVLEAIAAAQQTRLAGPQVAALAIGTGIVAERDDGEAAAVRQAFLHVFAATIEVDPGFFDAPRIRALFDRPLALAAAGALRQLGDGDDPALRRRASALLELLRQPALPSPGSLVASPDGSGEDAEAVASALLAANDSLGRIRAALRAHPDALALVSHVVDDAVSFLMIRGGGEPFAYEIAAADYRAACAALERAAYVAIRARGKRESRAEADLVAAGRRAFEALPSGLRDAIAGSRVLLLAPDFHGRDDAVPFELLHDGTAHLAATRVIARHPSLAGMAASLDAHPRTRDRRRALVVAAPVADGYATLELAALERQDIVDALGRQGFDAPSIDPARLSSAFLVDRLGYVDVLHVAAHGESGADLEWLVLPQGQQLLVDDLLRDPQYSLPFAYFSTCDLGQTRYLGAGVSRGFAHSFVELGAPAVIAHAKPVPDDAARRLAQAFYLRVADHDVGQALLDARNALREAGESAAVWASAILMGNPWHAVAGRDVPARDDPAADVLDAYFGIGADDARKARAWLLADLALAQAGSTGIDDPRLEAATGLVRAVSRLHGLQTDDEIAALDDAIAVADALQHLPARALLRLVRANGVDASGTGAQAIDCFADAIGYLAPLAAFEPDWEPLLAGARQRLALQRARLEGLEIRTHLPEGQEDDGGARLIMEALLGAQQAVEEQYGRVTLRDVENDAADIAWNAVVAGHPNAFESMPESVAFATQVARRLVQRGELDDAAMPHAPVLLAGMLRHLWDSQNLHFLAPELAEGQAGAVRALIDDIRARWSPPDAQDWYALVEPAAAAIDELLSFIDGLRWEEVYEHLDPGMDALAQRLVAMLDEVEARHPSALAGCAAYVSGTVMARNTFSPFDGSVPESIGERLAGVYHALDRDNPSRFLDYLSRGFATVTARPLDELARWRMQPDGGPAARPRDAARP